MYAQHTTPLRRMGAFYARGAAQTSSCVARTTRSIPHDGMNHGHRPRVMAGESQFAPRGAWLFSLVIVSTSRCAPADITAP